MHHDQDHDHDGPCCDAHGLEYEQIVELTRQKMIARGYAVVAVASAGRGRAAYAYTVGVRAYLGCEFAISGAISRETMSDALNALAVQARDGQLTALADGMLVDNVLSQGYRPRLRLADPGWHFGLIAAIWEAHDTPVWQAQWPDASRHYPGDGLYELPDMLQDDFTLPPSAGTALRR